MSYDNASWHYGGDFPSDLPSEAGSTHIGMFFAWMANHGFAGAIHTKETPEELQRLLTRQIVPGAYVRQWMDEKLWEEDFTDEGNAFAKAYYGDKGYYAALASVTKTLPSIYHLPDTWASYDKISPVIDRGFRKWKPASLFDRWFRR